MHLHTKGDKMRERKPNEIINILDSYNVKIVSITDHFKFDNEQFNNLKKNDKNILFIPGIECDIKIKDNEIRHFTISSENIETIKNFEHSKKSPIDIKTFIEKLNNAKKYILVSAHFMKHEKRSFKKIEDISKIFDKIKSPYIFKVLDFPSKNRKINAREHTKEFYPSFCFSDVRN
jgi:predicted metal-dependent phosphoesterase TrpH